MTQILASLNRCGSLTYISWSSDFASYFVDYLMDESQVILDIMDQCDSKIDLIKYI